MIRRSIGTGKIWAVVETSEATLAAMPSPMGFARVSCNQLDAVIHRIGSGRAMTVSATARTTRPGLISDLAPEVARKPKSIQWRQAVSTHLGAAHFENIGGGWLSKMT